MNDYRKKVLTAFPPVPFFGDVSSGCFCDECCDPRITLPGKSWSEIPADFIDFNSGSLPLMTPSGLQSFLPAWLLRSMERLADDNCVLSECTLYFLCPGSSDEEGWKEKEIAERVSLFNAAQRHVVRNYLDAIVADTRLEDWHPYAEFGLKWWTRRAEAFRAR